MIQFFQSPPSKTESHINVPTDIMKEESRTKVNNKQPWSALFLKAFSGEAKLNENEKH